MTVIIVEVNSDRPFVGTIASDIVAQVGVPGKEKDQIGLPALLRDLKASPAFELLQGGVPRDGQSSWTDAVQVNGSRLQMIFAGRGGRSVFLAGAEGMKPP